MLKGAKKEAVAKEKLSVDQKKALRPQYKLLLKQLKEKNPSIRDSNLPTLIEFSKGLSTLELCEYKDYLI